MSAIAAPAGTPSAAAYAGETSAYGALGAGAGTGEKHGGAGRGEHAGTGPDARAFSPKPPAAADTYRGPPRAHPADRQALPTLHSRSDVHAVTHLPPSHGAPPQSAEVAQRPGGPNPPAGVRVDGVIADGVIADGVVADDVIADAGARRA